jgi:UDP-N-acetyl-D-glucosamine dehydrogenase
MSFLSDRLLPRIEARSAKVAVLGQGYAGLPVAMRACECGFRVVGFEPDQGRLAALRHGDSYVEDIESERVARALRFGYLATDDPEHLRDFDIAVISVPTPLRDGVPDVSALEDAADCVSSVLRTGSLVALESTTYPGTTEELVRPRLEQSGLKAGEDYLLGYSPERIDPGSRQWPFERVPKVTSGFDGPSLEAMNAFYGLLVDTVVPVASTAEAELVKLLENTFRHVNIALVNELAMFARDLDVDIWNAIDAATTKPFGYMPFWPGPGVGGHCLPIDPSYLSWRVRDRLGQTFRFVELANDVNDHMPDYVVTRVTTLLNNAGRTVRGSRILLLGLSYKAGTSDWRESPSLVIAGLLSGLGANVRCSDPHVSVGPEFRYPLVELTDLELRSADLVVLLVDHPEFPLDVIAARGDLVFDAKGALRGYTFDGETL